VLSAFESAGFRAGAYGAASSSVLPAAAAAIGRVDELGLEHWSEGLAFKERSGVGMSQMILAGIEQAGPWLGRRLFQPDAPRFVIAASAVDEEGAIETQGKQGRRRGRMLLLDASRGDRSWVESHLTPHLFDTGSTDEMLRLTAENFAEVAYASSRMLHAWDIPAWVAGRPYVDAFYTSACPAVELSDLGYRPVIALATEPILYRDIFQQETIPEGGPEGRLGSAIRVIGPDFDPAEAGVNYTGATEDGLLRVYRHGISKGEAFLTSLDQV
jgi:hypothetical protein